MGDVVNMRSPEFLSFLKEHGFWVVAPADDPAWDGPKDRVHTAYRSADMEEIVVRPWTICYFPEHGEDWETHREAVRALDMLLFAPAGPRQAVAVSNAMLNKLFFPVTREWVNEFYHGRATMDDWFRYLERGLR